MHFLEWKCMNFAYDFTKVCSYGSNEQYSSIGYELIGHFIFAISNNVQTCKIDDNSLSPTMRQIIIWTYDGKFIDAYIHHSASSMKTISNRAYKIY